ncbi:MAG: flagellar filament capping protein FliD [Sulfuricurvum sp.]|uniref:flagellar filament capping protein FliD n=1 Tax=Sulfuricurvum sp. TaxID=2025608 RepID=UPI00261F41BE|nr:flagellar filament capping protein FliD [Sulfuricurvum sp.]MDD3596230.1 flagellar filament capping protein FliD [Sulfuricurvum sp.]
MAVSSLGAGSGVLTQSVIDQLKAADTASIITPIETKITLQQQKGQALSLLTSLFTTFQSSVSALNDSAIYQKRTVSGNVENEVSVTADAGVAVQSFSISDTQLAKKSVIESGRFSSTSSYISNGSGTMSIGIDGTTYDIDYTSSTTLADLVTAINDKAGSDLKASTLQVGTNDYRLILTSNETGASQAITISDSANGSLDYALYKQQDTIGSGLFTSATSSVLSSPVTQSTKLSLSQALSDGGVSIEIDGVQYSTAFDTDHATTLANFKDAIDASGLYTATISGNDITITANTAGANYTITSPFSTTDSSASASTTDTTPTVSGTYDITMNGTTYNVAYDQNTTLDSLVNSINSTVGSNVASIKQVGSSYQLVIESTAEGDDSTFSVSDSGGYLSSKLTTGITNYTPGAEVQQAQDASFKYNGITVTRSSNEITDIISGVTINLLKDGSSANIDIAQDVDSISTEMSTLVDSYNSLISQLTSMTTADTEAGTVGVFNGDSSITSISRDITRLFTSINNDGYSLAQFGIDLSEKGTMSFNSATFKTKFNEDTTLSEQFFSGLTTYDDNGNVASQKDGIFTQLNALTTRYLGSYGSDGILDNLTTASSDAVTSLTTDKTKAQALLDARYETMTARFVEYDSIMTKLTSQFSSLQMQIDAMASGG